MPTSAFGTSTDARPRSAAVAASRPPTRASGFTLLELLVVVTIIGLLAGAVMLSSGLVREDRDLEREALRLRSLIDLVREEAIMQSREHGILFTESGYRFYVYDYQTQRWAELPGDKLLAPHELAEPIELELRVEDRELVLDPAALGAGDERDSDDEDDDEGPQPQVMILSSGEMTPFEADFFRSAFDGRITVTAGLDGRLALTKDGFDDR